MSALAEGPRIFLASQSPRRRELLEQVGVGFDRLSIEVDETPIADETPTDYVTRLARAKALAGAQTIKDASMLVRQPVLGADTTVTVDGKILGKPNDAADARQMLLRLSGREHEVLTAISLAWSTTRTRDALSRSVVRFRTLYTEEIDDYWASGEPADKAGAYAIQGRGAVFVNSMSGSFSGVVGLPLFELDQLLAAGPVVD